MDVISPDGRWYWNGTGWVPRTAPAATGRAWTTEKTVWISIAIATFLILLVAGMAVFVKQEPTAFDRWLVRWDSMTPSQQVVMCSAWDASPSAAALIVEQSMHAPGHGKNMLGAVC